MPLITNRIHTHTNARENLPTMDSSSTSDISMSGFSPASTAQNEHESYETFQVKALALAEKLFAGFGKITVSQMHGGSNNRVVGININDQPKHVLRIPREPDCASMADEAAAFIFVKNHARLPCPEVVAYDAGDDNEIGSPFAIHARVPGDCLFPAWTDSVSVSEKVTIASQLGVLYRRMIETRSNVAAWPAFAADQTDTNAPVHLETYSLTAAEPFVDRNMVADRAWDPVSPPVQSVAAFIDAVFEAHQRKLPKLVSRKTVGEYVEMLGELRTVVSEIDSRGYFTNVGYSLYHNDIFPRNLAFDWAAGADTLTILDWDDVTFMPTFMACTPPTWVWEVDYRDDDDSEDQADLRRQAFEAAAGPEYMTYADDEVYDLLRELMSFVLMKTVSSIPTHDKAYNILMNWTDIKLADAEVDSPASSSG